MLNMPDHVEGLLRPKKVLLSAEMLNMLNYFASIWSLLASYRSKTSQHIQHFSRKKHILHILGPTWFITFNISAERRSFQFHWPSFCWNVEYVEFFCGDHPLLLAGCLEKVECPEIALAQKDIFNSKKGRELQKWSMFTKSSPVLQKYRDFASLTNNGVRIFRPNSGEIWKPIFYNKIGFKMMCLPFLGPKSGGAAIYILTNRHVDAFLLKTKEMLKM